MRNTQPERQPATTDQPVIQWLLDSDPSIRWPLDVRYPGEIHIETDEGVGRPSRWITLRALRVLKWYNAQS